MKNFILLVLTLVLSACESNPLNSGANDFDESENLSNQYSTDQVSTNAASNLNTQLGAGYIDNGRYDRALFKLEKALNQDSDNALAHNYLGVLYGKLERPEAAYEHFNKSLQLSPHNSTLLNNYATFLCDQKKYDEAIEKFNMVIGNPLYADRALAFQSAAWCAFKNDDYDLSESFYRKALKQDKNMPYSLLGMAKINYRQETYQLAWSYFQRFDQMSAHDADSLWLGLNIMKYITHPDKNIISSYQLQLKSMFPDSDETKWFYQGRQEY
ncbi:MAG: type IV pilus biogenesis/stability protein PilW [gamma proteobacterium symbiont of Taylorina sp.]|nr:type IV pilus biogenesis/stability protein PilW [gamma proteobacterium symbiont of Taylorina sp.]